MDISMAAAADNSYLKLGLPPDDARCRHPAAAPSHLTATPAAASSARAACSRVAVSTPEVARRHPALARHRVPPRGRVRTVGHARYLFGGSPLRSGRPRKELAWLSVLSSDPLCVPPFLAAARRRCGRRMRPCKAASLW